MESYFWMRYIQSFTRHHFISSTKANLGIYCQQFWFRVCWTSTYTVISQNFQCCLTLFKILRPAKRVNAEREAYIPHWGDITCSSAVSRRRLKLFVQQWLRKGQVPCSWFPPALCLFSKASSLIPSSSQSSSACVMCSSHAHFQLLIWPDCLLGKVFSGRSLQVHEQVSSKCY